MLKLVINAMDAEKHVRTSLAKHPPSVNLIHLLLLRSLHLLSH
jgi:hypothetical protein